MYRSFLQATLRTLVGAGLGLALWACSGESPTPFTRDSVPPTVSLTAPAPDTRITTTVEVTADARDDVGVAGVQFLLDGSELGTEDLAAPYAVSWDPAPASKGPHALAARARDRWGNLATSSEVPVVVGAEPMTQPPKLVIHRPTEGAALASTEITIEYGTTGELNEVDHVHFQLDGGPVAMDTTLDGVFALSGVTSGAHSLSGDLVRADHTTIPDSNARVSFTVALPDTVAPTVAISEPASGAEVSGSISVSADASDDVAVVGVEFFLDGVALGAEDTAAPFSVPWDTSSASNGIHTLTARARDAAGNTAESAPADVTVRNTLPDTLPPTVAVTAPAPGAEVSATVEVRADGSDNVGVTGVQFLLDGAALGAEDVDAPYAVSWNTSSATNGAHTLTARARDAAGNTATSAAVDVTVRNTTSDTVPPTVAVTAPAAGTEVSAAVEVRADASDNIGVTGVQFLLDGAVLGAEDVAAPYLVSWNTNSATNGAHTLTARARDAAGNTATSAAVSVTVANVPKLLITEPLEGAAITGTAVAVRYTTSGDLTGVDHVHFQLDGGPVLMDLTLDGSFDLTGVAAGTHTLAGVLSRTDHSTVVGSGDSVSFSTSVPDTTPPSVALTAPAAGASVTGMVNLTASATDNVGVAGVQFLLDGAALGQEDATAPYAVTWDSRTVVNGSHTLAARARDAAGNVATSPSRTVQVANTTTGGFFNNEILVTGLTLPTVLKFLPDGKMLIAELGGRVVVLRPGATAVDSTPFLLLSNIGTLNGQQGIMDIVLDPNFSANGHYYVFYTLGTPNRDRVSRFTASGLTTQLATETVVWQDDDDAHEEHHGGALNFGADGKLYIATGEHFDAPLAQSLRSYRGKLLRFNRDGTVPTDNPFHDGAGPNKDAIWALGLRNPYRAFYDAPSGRLFIGDVGGNDFNTAVEELNLAARGANYGWPDCEGPCTDARYTDPLYSYRHDGRDAAITGGFVYRGTQFPSE